MGAPLAHRPETTAAIYANRFGIPNQVLVKNSDAGTGRPLDRVVGAGAKLASPCSETSAIPLGDNGSKSLNRFGILKMILLKAMATGKPSEVGDGGARAWLTNPR